MKKRLLAAAIGLTMLGLCSLCSCGSIDGDSSQPEAPAESDAGDIVSVSEKDPSGLTSEPDGAAPAERTVELDLSDSEKPQVIKASLSGMIGEGADIENAYGRDVISSGVVGLFGCPVKVELDGGSGVLSFEVDRDNMDNVPIENLIVLCKNSDRNDDFSQVESSLSGNTITARISRSDVYMLADCYQWFSAWGMDANGYAHDMTFSNGEFDFAFTLPAETVCCGVSDSWHSANGMMERELIHQYDSKDADLTVNLTAMRFTDDRSECSDPLPAVGLDELTDEIIKGLTAAEYIDAEAEPKQTMELADGRKGYLLNIHMSGDTSKGISEQSMVSGYFEYSDDTYIVLSYFLWGSDEQLISKAEDSVRSFDFTGPAKEITAGHEPDTDYSGRYSGAVLEEADGRISFSSEELGFSMAVPRGFGCEIADLETNENSDGEKSTPLIRLTSDSLYYGSVYDVTDRYTAYIDANGMYNFYDKTMDSHTAIKRDQYVMSNGGKAYVMMLSVDRKTDCYGDENGVYDFCGFYETGASDVYTCIRLTADKGITENQQEQLYSCLKSFDCTGSTGSAGTR